MQYPFLSTEKPFLPTYTQRQMSTAKGQNIALKKLFTLEWAYDWVQLVWCRQWRAEEDQDLNLTRFLHFCS